MKKISALISTGNLGDNIIEKESFYEGLNREIDFFAADAGTADAGPTFLGSDSAHNPIEWEEHDLELLLLASRKKNVPMIVGSCSTTGTNSAVDRYAIIIRNLAKKHKLKPFKMALIYSEINKEYLLERINNERKIEPLNAPEKLDIKAIQETSYVTASMGVEQIIHALSKKSDVILAGRACDDAVIAAYPIFRGFDKGISLHMGKAAECASLVCWPQKVKESIVATTFENFFEIEPLHPEQKATPHSVAAHSMYERTNPFFQGVPGGVLDMTNSKYEAVNNRIARISGSIFVPSEDGTYNVKLEGAGFAGYRVYHIVGIRDINAIRHIDKILEDTHIKVSSVVYQYKIGIDYQLTFHVYGKDAIMKSLEPENIISSNELCIIIEAIAKSEKIATAVVKAAKFRLFYMNYPGQMNSSGGSVALLTDEPLYPKNKCYKWTIDHLLSLNNPIDDNVFKYSFEIVGA
jgi:hypothetical protein